MGFKVYSDSLGDVPYFVCDICGQRIGDFFSDLASGSKGSGQTPGNVTIHHKTCALPSPAPVNMALGDFLALVLSKNRVGSLGNIGTMNRVTIEIPLKKEFES
jgi:hypothetical protein